MITALLSLIGSAGSGKLLGLASDFFQNRAQEKADEAERAHQRDLASRGKLAEYLKATHHVQEGDNPTLFSRTLCLIYLMFASTACLACLYCFYLGFDGTALIKDPDQEGTKFSFIGFSWEFQARNISELSPLGVGYLILHPILFILSMVSTGTKGPRRR